MSDCTSTNKKKTPQVKYIGGNIKESKQTANLLTDDATGHAMLKVVLENRDVHKLAQLWVLGVEIDWRLLYDRARPQRISLPTYPFARERYWIPESDTEQPGRPTKIGEQHGQGVQPELRSMLTETMQQIDLDVLHTESRETVAYVEKKLIEQIINATGLSIKQLDINSSFAEYGVDSITGIRLVNGINQTFGIQLQTAALLQNPDIASLAQYLYAEFGDEIKRQNATSKTFQNGTQSEQGFLAKPRSVVRQPKSLFNSPLVSILGPV
ncbi:hypothetical protein KFU94_70790 [Chloroflexi bacterium TSY]|nr:hypothetical protein [Chloroflexi bacterium TSY]